MRVLRVEDQFAGRAGIAGVVGLLLRWGLWTEAVGGFGRRGAGEFGEAAGRGRFDGGGGEDLGGVGVD